MSAPAILADAVVDAALVGSPWRREGSVLRLERSLSNFASALGFVVSVGVLAERADHHPDIDIRYSKVSLTLTTHEATGLTQRDLDLAAQISTLI